MALSYWATAMSRPARAESSPAWLRPASKMGSMAWGASIQLPEPPLNRSDSALLAVPALAVRAMRGKNAARAAPMLALAAISCCSAWRMSGRRSSRSDGMPSGTSRRASARSSPCIVGSSRSGRGCPTSSVSAFTSSARKRCCWARVERAAAARDSACRRSRADVTPWSKRKRLSRRESSRVASVRCVRTSSSSLVCRLSQVLTTEATRLICTALRASCVARNCARAASFKLARRPKKSISQDASARPAV